MHKDRRGACPRLDFEWQQGEQSGVVSQAVLYARMNGEIVGAADVVIEAGRLEVRVLYVRPAFRGRGIAGEMLRHLGALHPLRRVVCPSKGTRAASKATGQ